MRAYEDHIYWIAGQAVGSNRVSRDEPPMKNLEVQPDYIRENDVGSHPICQAHRKDPWKSVVGSVEHDEDNQPDTKCPKTENQKPLEKAHQ